VCNLYSLTKGQDAIRRVAKAMRDMTGNLPALPAIFPDTPAPVVRTGEDGARELVMMRWGLPSPAFALKGRKTDPGVTNVRNVTSPHWRRWLGVEHRCVVPFTSFSAAERIQYEGSLRREEANAAIKTLAKAGVSIKQFSRRTGHSRKLVRAVIRVERTDIFRVRQSSLEPHLPWLDAQWVAGARNATALWRRLTAQGFRGSLRVIREWATRRRRAEQAGIEALQRVPSARTLARLMTTGRDRLTKAQTVLVAAIAEGEPPLVTALVTARVMVAAFQAMVRAMAPIKLDGWIERGSTSLIAAFARGRQRQSRCARRAQPALVERSNRRTDHEAEARGATDVWGAARSTCWKLASSVLHDTAQHQSCVRAKIARLNTIEAGAILPEHSHPHEQVVNMLDGELEMVVDGVRQPLRAGDVLMIPGGSVHSGRSLTPCRVLDVFHLVLMDYKTAE
jgi:mannose-6-phosphate isomerase-like protein (cupin superfamily)